ncbi:unnamed protein product [Rhizoctonia solani]|uniref:Uncharacterized protein n=1 Tax=Rhizoctonia solani TaxID=456999 RepID=A0A8H3E1P8_9AGAM|nr:unnamed protein product [Rhizoctonia solani]
MPLGALASVPGFTPLLRFIDDLMSTGYSTSRSERETFILHMQHVIIMLEGALTSASSTDAQWILSLKMRLAKYLEDLTPSNPSLIRRLRARWIYHEHFIHETKREIDTALRLIELKAMVSLSGGLVSLHGGMERLMSTAFGIAPGERAP